MPLYEALNFAFASPFALNLCMSVVFFLSNSYGSSIIYDTMASQVDSKEDPGIFFILATESKIHDCFELPSVALLQPPLQRGRNKKNIILITV